MHLGLKDLLKKLWKQCCSKSFSLMRVEAHILPDIMWNPCQLTRNCSLCNRRNHEPHEFIEGERIVFSFFHFQVLFAITNYLRSFLWLATGLYFCKYYKGNGHNFRKAKYFPRLVRLAEWQINFFCSLFGAK